MKPDNALSRAVELHQAGRFAEAEQIYRDILSRQPRDANALFLLGSLAHQTGRGSLAVELIERAIAADPRAANYHNNLGAILVSQNRAEDAVNAYRRAIALEPRHAEAYYNLGMALSSLKRTPEACDAFERAARLKPDSFELFQKLGGALRELGRFPEALSAYRRALELRPNSPAVCQELGLALVAMKRPEEALAAFGQGVQFRPDSAELLYNYATALHELGRISEAETAYRRALALKPDRAEALNNLAIVLAKLGKMEESLEVCRKVCQIAPDAVAAYSNMGNVLRELGRIDEAFDAYHRAIELNPNYAEAYTNLGNALLKVARVDEALRAFRTALDLKPDEAHFHSNAVFAMCFDTASSAQDIYTEARRWDERHGRPARTRMQPHRNLPDPTRRIKLGYVSADFRGHVVGWNLLPCMRHHDRGQFEITCYSSSIHGQDKVTQELKSLSDHWREVTAFDDEKLADQIRADRIDVLVDLSLHTANNRLRVFAMEPAPVQVTYLGYCSTSGVQAMHYRFSDPYLDPPEQDLGCYSEQTIRLPRSYWCYEPGRVAPEVGPPPSEKSGVVTFGCLNQFAKVSPAALDLWAEILGRVPESRLLLHAPKGNYLQSVVELFSRHGISADRVEFIGTQPWELYMRTYHRIDIGLDPFPYNGGITSCDTLLMGVPLVTLSGRTSVGRGGRSILSSLGLTGLIAHSPEECVRIAADLAADSQRRAELRMSLRDRMKSSPLMDAPPFARDIENAFRRMWQNWCSKS